MPKPAKRIVDEVLGELVAGPQQRRSSDWRQWTGSVKQGQHRVSLALGGDADAPRSGLLTELRTIVLHLDEVIGGANVQTTWPAARVVCHRVVIARDYRAVDRGGSMRLPAPKVPADYPGPR